MLIGYFIIFLVLLLFVVAIIFGGKYSVSMQELSKIQMLLEMGQIDKVKGKKRFLDLRIRIKKNKKRSHFFLITLLIVQLLSNWVFLNDLGVFYLSIFSLLFAYSILLIVYWLRGAGTIDSNQRMNGGMRV